MTQKCLNCRRNFKLGRCPTKHPHPPTTLPLPPFNLILQNKMGQGDNDEAGSRTSFQTVTASWVKMKLIWKSWLCQGRSREDYVVIVLMLCVPGLPGFESGQYPIRAVLDSTVRDAKRPGEAINCKKPALSLMICWAIGTLRGQNMWNCVAQFFSLWNFSQFFSPFKMWQRLWNGCGMYKHSNSCKTLLFVIYAKYFYNRIWK